MSRTPPREVQSWNLYFSDLAARVASRSKHPRSQHGAVLVNQRNRLVSTGYNGAPYGFPEDELDWAPGMTWTSRDWTVHAEENALLYAGEEKARGCTLYVTGLPCPRCALRIVQCGVRAVICGGAEYSKMGEDFEILKRICQLARLDVFTLNEQGSVVEVFP